MNYLNLHRLARRNMDVYRERYGQAYFNALHTLAPEIANEIRGTEADPFYLNENIEAFFNYLAGTYGLDIEGPTL